MILWSMATIERTLTKVIIANNKHGFINIIYGPRRVGKTVLLEQIAARLNKKTVWFNGDTQEARDSLSSTSEFNLSKLVESSEVVIIDEAQRIENIGLSLKILIDKFSNKTFLVSGSSSLALSKGVKETLTGRTQKYKLYPLSTKELTARLPDIQKTSVLESQLIYGGYPYLQSLALTSEKEDYLKSIVDDYLFRDLLLLKDFGSSETLRKLTTLLAFQIGSQVSLNELARNLLIDVKTVSRYISLLKQSFVIFEIGAYSTNPRKEVAKSKKYYFWDLGIRNGLTGQFFALGARTDIGSLWENFMAVELIKKAHYRKLPGEFYFWRSYGGAEIDWIEKSADTINAFEFKWQSKKTHTPKLFAETYKTKVETISKENYLEVLL